MSFIALCHLLLVLLFDLLHDHVVVLTVTFLLDLYLLQSHLKSATGLLHFLLMILSLLIQKLILGSEQSHLLVIIVLFVSELAFLLTQLIE